MTNKITLFLQTQRQNSRKSRTTIDTELSYDLSIKKEYFFIFSELFFSTSSSRKDKRGSWRLT